MYYVTSQKGLNTNKTKQFVSFIQTEIKLEWNPTQVRIADLFFSYVSYYLHWLIFQNVTHFAQSLILPNVTHFWKCDPCFYSVTHFSQCDSFFWLWTIFHNVTHFKKFHLFCTLLPIFFNVTHF